MRLLAVLTTLTAAGFALAGCGPNYSPNTYATNAAQQANKVDSGVIAGVRKVQISASGTVGGVAGAAAGGVAGAQVGTGPTSAFTAIGGTVIGGLAGVASEHIVGDTNGFEYIVRKANGEMISVAQKDEKPLKVGEKVLVIAGPQARIVPDYTVPSDAPEKAAATPPVVPTPPPAVSAAPSVPPKLPEAAGPPTAASPPVVTPPDAPAPSASAGTTAKP